MKMTKISPGKHPDLYEKNYLKKNIDFPSSAMENRHWTQHVPTSDLLKIGKILRVIGVVHKKERLKERGIQT